MIGAGAIITSVFAAGAATILSGGTSTTSSSSTSMADSGSVTISSSSVSSATTTSAATTSSTSNSFADFDFANGTVLPGKATLWIGNATYKPGSSTAYVPVYLDRATPNTVIARITTVNGTGTLKATSGTNYKTVDTVVIFHRAIRWNRRWKCRSSAPPMASSSA
ncbi:hypothetical protein ACFSUK_06145 [Sphingobium scionense]